MERSKIDPAWPKALRCFLALDLTHFTPWRFIQEPDELAFAANAYRREDVHGGDVFVFARRQDRDDFAGLELIGGRMTGKVICFHPVFSNISRPSPRTWSIDTASFDDVFAFMAQCVIPDMKDWFVDEDPSYRAAVSRAKSPS